MQHIKVPHKIMHRPLQVFKCIISMQFGAAIGMKRGWTL